MDAELFTPFIASVQNVFSTMLQLPVTVGEPGPAPARRSRRDVRATVTMSGDLFGSVSLALSPEVATAVASLFTGQRLQPGDPLFADAIGELVNMICGNAKAMFPGPRRVSISCPFVVIDRPEDSETDCQMPGFAIPCVTDCGPLTILVALCETSALHEHAPREVAPVAR